MDCLVKPSNETFLDLMPQLDLASGSSRLKNGQANLERREAPFARMQWRSIPNHRVVKFVNHLRARNFW